MTGLVADAKRIVANRGEHSTAELRWALDTLTHARVVKSPITMKPPITQAQLSEAVARFASVVAMLRDFEERSDPDTGGSVEPGELRLDAPVLDADVDILEQNFRDVFIRRSV